LRAKGRHQLAIQLHDQVGLVRYDPPELVVKPLRPVGTDWPRELAGLEGADRDQLDSFDCRRRRKPSLLEQEKMAEEQVRSEVLQDPRSGRRWMRSRMPSWNPIR
jgi:DNA polymerase III subunit gamma/tau